MCGVPSLPDCPLFWKNGGLSKNGKIAIGISCLIFVCLLSLLIYICCIRRGRNDYDFGLPHELTCKFFLPSIVLPKYYVDTHTHTQNIIANKRPSTSTSIPWIYFNGPWIYFYGVNKIINIYGNDVNIYNSCLRCTPIW